MKHLPVRRQVVDKVDKEEQDSLYTASIQGKREMSPPRRISGKICIYSRSTSHGSSSCVNYCIALPIVASPRGAIG